MRLTLTILILAAFGVSFAGETVTVEKLASDIPAVLEQVKQDVVERPAAPEFKAKGVTNIWVQTDCQEFVFEENSPAKSEPKDFRSETWLEECINIPLPNPPGGGTCIPQRRLFSVDQRTVTIEIKDREVPGPKESFRVCLWGRSLSLKKRQSPFKYDVEDKTELFNTEYILTKK
ncbi:MAG: hypothetical protein ABII00_04665 [Elusimicrobiota bacterium]